MDLSQCTRSLGLFTLLATSLAFAACGSSTPDTDSGVSNKDGTVNNPDAGTNMDAEATDNGNTTPDTGVDGGTRPDGGRMDAGMRDTGITPGLEGNPCTFDPNNAQGDCADPALECVGWDLAANSANPENSNATCVRSCESNAGCTGAGFGECVGLWSWDEVTNAVRFRSYCAPTRAAKNAECRPGREGASNPVQGCAVGQACMAGFDGNTGTSPIKGTCTTTCSWTRAAPQGDRCGANEVCTPFLDAATATTAVIGFCTDHMRLPGQACTDNDPNKACAFTFETFCGTSATSNEGECMDLCDAAQPAAGQCDAMRSGVNGMTYPITCPLIVTTAGGQQLGICSLGCSQFPDNCDGTNTCEARFFGQMGIEVDICNDRSPPNLPAVIPTFNGAQITIPQGSADCAAANMNTCEPNSTCQGVGMNQGRCLTGCSTSTNAAFVAAHPRGGCETFTSTSVKCHSGFDMMNPNNGFCGLP
ncbi:MAG: hypothetical protein U1E65_33195 [Myxococcota bacterium]